MPGGFSQEHHAKATVHLSVSKVHKLTTTPLAGILLSAHPHISLVSTSPRMLMIKDFLSPRECQVRSCQVQIHTFDNSFRDYRAKAALLIKIEAMTYCVIYACRS